MLVRIIFSFLLADLNCFYYICADFYIVKLKNDKPMKKLLIAMFALIVGIAFTSCKQKTEVEPEKAATEEKVEKAEKAESLEDLVARAKAEGANWSVDEWKAAVKQAFIAMKPVMDNIQKMTEKTEDENPDLAKIKEVAEDLEKNQAEYERIEKLFEELNTAASATANGKAVIDDEEWGNAVMKELGFPEDM